MDLIRIKKEKVNSEFLELLRRLRKDSENALSREDITKDVEEVRKSRYEK